RPVVRHAQPRELHRVGARNEQQEILFESVPAVAVAAVAPAVARLVRAAAGRGTRRGRPDGAVLLVAQVPRLAVRIRDRVVGPRREAVLAAVARPRVARARLGGEEAEGLVGDDVDPRRGRQTQPGAVRLQARPPPRRARRRTAVRDGPRTLHRPRPRRAAATRTRGRRAALRHGGQRAGPGGEPAARGGAGGRRERDAGRGAGGGRRQEGGAGGGGANGG